MPRSQPASPGRVPGFRRVNTSNGRSTPRGHPAQSGCKTSVSNIVCAKPIHPDFAAAVRATSRKRTSSITCCGAATFMALTTTPPSGTWSWQSAIARSAATALLAIRSARPGPRAPDADAAAAGAGLDILLQISGIDHDIDIEDADLLHRTIEQDDVGGAGLLALDVDQVIA